MKKQFLVSILIPLLTLNILCIVSIHRVRLVSANPGSIKRMALIVCGDKDDEFYYNGSKKAYIALNALNYDIRYLDTKDRDEQDGPDWYRNATRAKLNQTINDWLIPDADGDDLVVIYLVDHGNSSEGHGNSTIFFLSNGMEYITYYELNSWIAGLSYGRLLIVVDACFSGGAIRHLSGEDRIVISAGKVGKEVAKARFSRYFWPKVENDTITDAFNYAAEAAWNDTQIGYPPYLQEAQLDDDGDGDGHWTVEYQLPNELGDGWLAG